MSQIVYLLCQSTNVTNCLSALPILPPNCLWKWNLPYKFVYVGTKGHSRLLIAPHCANLRHTSKLTLRVLKH